MKVICISKNREHNKNSTAEMKVFYSGKLTIGKTYHIITYIEFGTPQYQYFIADDGTELIYYDNDKDFITSEQHREQQLNKIGI